MFCIECQSSVENTQKNCAMCGAEQPLESDNDISCPFCAENISIKAIKCKHCGSIIDQEKLHQKLNDMDGTNIRNIEDLSDYYKNAFTKIDANNGNFTVEFNWAAFFFGAFWYLFKGMWIKGLLMIVIAFMLAGIPFIFFWIYCSIAGTYDYYLLKIKGKQLW